MKRLTLVGFLLASLIAVPVSAQNGFENFERLLLPISPGLAQGAYGSEWQTVLALTNLADTPLSVAGYVLTPCPFQCAPSPPIPPDVTLLALTPVPSREVNGDFIWVERGRRQDLAVTLRTRDLSRQNETWGTVLPVISEDELRSQPFGIVDVPVDQQFRSMLRIYDFNGDTPGAVRVTFHAVNPMRNQPPGPVPDARPDEKLLELTPAFTIPFASGGTLSHPAYVEVPLWTQPALLSADRVRIVVEPLDGKRDSWAFVSVTHNETQHVTIITPK